MGSTLQYNRGLISESALARCKAAGITSRAASSRALQVRGQFNWSVATEVSFPALAGVMIAF